MISGRARLFRFLRGGAAWTFLLDLVSRDIIGELLVVHVVLRAVRAIEVPLRPAGGTVPNLDLSAEELETLTMRSNAFWSAKPQGLPRGKAMNGLGGC